MGYGRGRFITILKHGIGETSAKHMVHWFKMAWPKMAFFRCKYWKNKQQSAIMGLSYVVSETTRKIPLILLCSVIGMIIHVEEDRAAGRCSLMQARKEKDIIKEARGV